MTDYREELDQLRTEIAALRQIVTEQQAKIQELEQTQSEQVLAKSGQPADRSLNRRKLLKRLAVGALAAGTVAVVSEPGQA